MATAEGWVANKSGVWDSPTWGELVQIAMLETPADLPEDITELQAMIGVRDDMLAILETEIRARDYQIEKLKHGRTNSAVRSITVVLERPVSRRPDFKHLGCSKTPLRALLVLGGFDCGAMI